MHALSLILLLSLAVAAVVSVKDLPFDVKLKVRNILKACDFIEARLTNVDNVVEIVAPGDKESVLLVFKLGRAATFMCGFWHTARRNGPPPNVSAALWHNLLTTAYMDCLSDEAGVKMVQKVLWGDSDGHSKALKIYDNLMLEETSVGKYTSPVALMRILNLGSHVKQSRLRFMRSVRREDQKIQFRIAMKTFWRQPESPLETALREQFPEFDQLVRQMLNYNMNEVRFSWDKNVCKIFREGFDEYTKITRRARKGKFDKNYSAPNGTEKDRSVYYDDTDSDA